MDREELIEVMARAICREYGDPGDYWIAYADLAEAALSAIEGAGFVVVPRIPTEAMLIAMGTNTLGVPARIGGYLDDFDARGVWDAMINAYSPKPSGED